MQDRNDLLKLCIQGLKEKNVVEDKRYKDRLKKEIKEIDAQGEHVYFLNLYKDFNNKKLIFPYNQHNLLVVWLLGLANDFDIEKDYAWAQGEFPDIDIDYLKDIRDYLKRTWAADTFGQEYICEIGTYGTSGIKSASLDMARVYDADKDVLQQITNKMADRDDDGNELDWDKALELYPDFKSYCEKHPEVSDAAQQLLDRIRTGGVHAGGLIVADRRLDGFVPLEVRMVNKDNPNGVICSAWTEGLNRQDLGPVGLIKFDLLVISNLMQIALACELIKKRHGLDKICALPGQWDFSDISYLNDPKAIEMADRGDLKCVFQFDSEGIRKLVKRGGVSSFDDLAAYSAIYRPGPLNCGMDAHYCKRKKGEEPYSIHPIMEKSLGKTYGVLVFQEQIMDILRVVGEIPDMHTEKVRKAISKKKVKEFIKYKEMFVENGQKNLGVNEEYILDLWNQIESFAEYGFNKTLTEDTIIDCVDGSKQIKHIRAGDKVYCINEKGERAETEVVAVHDHGVIDVVEVTFDDGYSVKCTLDHKFLTKEGQIPLWKIIQDNLVVLSSPFGEQNAKEKKLGSNLRRDSLQQKKNYRTSQKLYKMQRDVFTKENRKIQPQSSLRKEVSNKTQTSRSFERMSGLYLFEMARDRKETHISMRDRIFEIQFVGGTPSSLCEMHGNKKREHSKSNGQVEQRQSVPRSQGNIFCNCQENFGKERCSRSKICTIKKMEGQQPGGVCEIYRKGTTCSQKIKNGNVVERISGMEAEENMLWNRQEICGFGKEKYLDRGGWTFSLLADRIKIEQKRPQFELCSTQGRDAQRGVFEETRYNAFEVEHDLFSQKNRRNEERKLGSVPDYAPISDTGNLVHRRVLRIMPVGKRQCYDLEVDVSTHNFILPNGVVTSNSHSYAYTYISARLLWLKAHYPLEFYAAILMCETDTDKFKEYKIDAEKHGIEICPVHINKSKKNFVIEDGKIYFGFSNIKTIGEEVADRIVANQPYADISDFLEKFGTDTIPIKALTSLGVFEENHDRITMRKFSEYYKKQANSRRDRRKRFEQSLENKNQDLKELIKQEIEEDDPMFDKLCNFTQDSFDACVKVFDGINKDVEYKNKGEIKIKKVPFIKLIQDLFNKRQASIDSFNKKEKEDDEFKITIEEFNSSLISLDKEEEKILKEELVINGKKSYPLAESMYYGFQWTHVLETCPEYAGNTIDKFLESCDIGNIKNKFIEVQINKVKKRTSKKGTEFYSVEAEDANGKNVVINVWQEDFTRFREEFFVGNLVCLEVNPPSGGFNTFTFKSYPKHLKKTMPDKEADVRLYVLKRPQTSHEKDLSNNLQEDNYHIFK